MEKGEIPFLSIFCWYFLGMELHGYYGHIKPKENKGNKKVLKKTRQTIKYVL